eukprot:5495700-Prorocentrum_lima.AAC.1
MIDSRTRSPHAPSRRGLVSYVASQHETPASAKYSVAAHPTPSLVAQQNRFNSSCAPHSPSLH